MGGGGGGVGEKGSLGNSLLKLLDWETRLECFSRGLRGKEEKGDEERPRALS